MPAPLRVQTDVEGARTLRRLIDSAQASSTLAGPVPPAPAGRPGSVVVEIISDIAANDASQHSAILCRLVADVFEDSLQRVLIRNISKSGLSAGDRYIATPVSTLGLCVEAPVADTAELFLPEPLSYCCGTCLPQGTHSVTDSIVGAASYSFFAPAVKCCPNCDMELTSDTAYATLSGQPLDLIWEDSSKLYVSDDATCGSTETVRWELDLSADTLIYRESTGIALVTYTAKITPAPILCPMKFELTSYNTDCYVCGDEVCVRPSEFEPSTGCMGCDAAKEWPAFYTIATGEINLVVPTSTTITQSTTWASGDENRWWYVRAPDLSAASDPVLMRADLLKEGGSNCAWWRTDQRIFYMEGHSAAVKLSGGCCTDPNYVGHDSDWNDLGLVPIPESQGPLTSWLGLDAGLVSSLRPSNQCGNYVVNAPAGGTNCGNAFAQWTCFHDLVGWHWVLSGSGTNMTVTLRAFIGFLYRIQRTRTVADACSETRAGGRVSRSSAVWSTPTHSLTHLDPPTADVPTLQPEAVWTASSICANTGAITLTLSSSTATSFVGLPSTITVIPSNAQEPPSRLVRRNCDDSVGSSSLASSAASSPPP